MSEFDTNKRLMEYLKFKEISLYKFANEIGLKSVSYLYNVRKNKHVVSKNILDHALIFFPSLSEEWLKSGSGEMEKVQEYQDVLKIQNLGLRDELAFKEKTELYAMYWSNSSFKLSIQKLAMEKGISETEVIIENAYKTVDIMLKVRSRNS